jgi:hypothetical protein
VESVQEKTGAEEAGKDTEAIKDTEVEAAPDKLPVETLDEESDAQEEVVGPRPVPAAPSGGGDAEEILELFKSVDKKMKAIDDLLFDIGAGEVPMVLPQDSGLQDLLDLTKSASEDVVKDIDKILKIASEMGKQKSGGKPSGQSKPGQSGPPKEGEDQGKEPGQDGKEPGEGEQEPKDGEDPEGDGKKPGEEDAEPKDGEPNSGKESDEPGQNSPNGGAGDATLGAGSKANLSERWGELPERVRETFRNQGGESVPLFYRDWIESYYRHLNHGDSKK